jgi:hypothetical protein
MKMWIIALFSGCIAPALFGGQLYLLTGTPSGAYLGSRFPSSILKVGSGAIIATAEVVPESIGTEWIAVSYDFRKALFLSLDSNALVVDLDSATLVKKCKLPSDGSLIEQWLADVPGRGQTFEWYTGVGRDDNYYHSLVLDSPRTCDESLSSVQAYEIKFLVAHGRPGVANMPGKEGTYVYVNRDGSIDHGQGDEFEFKIPTSLRADMPDVFQADLVINTNMVFVISIPTDSGPRYLALRKADGTWRTIPSKSETYGRLQAFGTFIAITEERTKKAIVERRAQSPHMVSTSGPEMRDEQSAGRSEWKRSRSGPDLVERFDDSEAVYPGRLHLYNLATEKLYTITTNQGDSEVLLVEDKIVYYRISDRLYSAAVTDKGIGIGTLVATDEAIRDAHWAFIGH